MVNLRRLYSSRFFSSCSRELCCPCHNRCAFVSCGALIRDFFFPEEI